MWLDTSLCLITGVTWCEHITPALCQLHWLPVCRRVDFKISTLVYHSLAGTAPVYLDDEWLPPLATVLCGLLTTERAWSRDHATAVRPALWNSLPEQLPQPDITFGQFKRSLKTFVFG